MRDEILDEVGKKLERCSNLQMYEFRHGTSLEANIPLLDVREPEGDNTVVNNKVAIGLISFTIILMVVFMMFLNILNSQIKR